MSYGQTWDIQSTEPDEKQYALRFVGGSAAVTKLFGRGMTITYISTGVVDVTFLDNPYIFLGVAGFCFDATVQSGVAGYSVVAGDAPTGSPYTFRLNIFNGSNSLADLSASQRLSVRLAFKQTNA
jgi:hypothetical protein